MKRSELTVGLEAYHSRYSDWDTPATGTGYGNKVTVLAVEPYSDKHDRWSRDYSPRQVAKGTGVLVEMEGWNGAKETKVVPLSQLRGVYADVMAQLEEYAKRRDAREAQVIADRTEGALQIDALSAQMKALGYTGHLYAADHYQAEVKVPVGLLAKMVDALQAAGWTYSK